MATTPPPTACTLPNSAAQPSLIDHALRINGWHKRGRELQTCGTLLPAHTGTSRLAWTVSQRSRFAQHFHQDFFEDQYGRGARCFFMTVRDVPVCAGSSVPQVCSSRPRLCQPLRLSLIHI